MSTLLITIHIIVCFVLIIAVLMQSGKAADLAGAFGGAGSQTVFGPRGAANFLSKITTACAIIFMLTSLGFWMISAKGTTSALSGEETPAKEPATVTESTKEPEEKKASTTEQKQEPEQKSTETEKKD